MTTSLGTSCWPRLHLMDTKCIWPRYWQSLWPCHTSTCAKLPSLIVWAHLGHQETTHKVHIVVVPVGEIIHVDKMVPPHHSCCVCIKNTSYCHHALKSRCCLVIFSTQPHHRDFCQKVWLWKSCFIFVFFSPPYSASNISTQPYHVVVVLWLLLALCCYCSCFCSGTVERLGSYAW